MSQNLARFALALAAAASLLPAPARAALITDVADAAEENDPLDVNVDLGWRRLARTAKIVRDAPGSSVPFAELVHTRTTQILDARLAIGLFHDLELHFNLPFAVEDAQSWDYATVNGTSVEDRSIVKNNRSDADGGDLVGGPRPLFPVPSRVFRAGLMDPSVGVAWGLSNDQRDKKLPDSMFPFKARVATWVLGFDYTLPLVDPMNPLQALSSTASNALSLGVGAHRFTWWSAMSKRLGIVEPFLKVHYTLSVPSDRAWDNCNALAVDENHFRMSKYATDKCAAAKADVRNPTRWTGKTGLVPPHQGGVSIGTEFVPVEDGEDGVRAAFVLQGAADYVSEGRYYTDISDVLGRLTYADQFFRMSGQLSFDLRLSRWVHFVSSFSLASETPHALTAERTNGGYSVEYNNSVETIEIGSEKWNPNYDFRLDQPGRRLGVSEVVVLGVSALLQVNF
jgi:hypothetical protein